MSIRNQNRKARKTLCTTGRGGAAAELLEGRRMLAGIGWSMTVLPKLDGTVDKVRLAQFMDSARLHYGTCVRDLPPDWPATLLPPLPNGLAPGLPVSHIVTPVASSHEADASTLLPRA